MPASQEVIQLATSPAFSKRMPARSEALARQVVQLSRRDRRRADAAFRQTKLLDRMARRATEIAGFNPHPAIRIVNAMRHISRDTAVLEALRQAGYLQKQATRAARHLAGGNEETAGLIRQHLLDLNADKELSKLDEDAAVAAEVGRFIQEPPPRAQTLPRESRAASFVHEIGARIA